MSIDLAAWHHRDRIARIRALAPEDVTAGLIWLALNFPATCDAMLDKAEWDGVDDDPAPPATPNPTAPSAAPVPASSSATAPAGGTTAATAPSATPNCFDTVSTPGMPPVIARRPSRTLAAAR